MAQILLKLHNLKREMMIIFQVKMPGDPAEAKNEEDAMMQRGTTWSVTQAQGSPKGSGGGNQQTGTKKKEKETRG